MTKNITVKQFTDADLKNSIALLEDWVTIPETGEVDHDRIERIFTLIQVEPKHPGDRVYLVAKEAQKIVGMVGYKEPCGYMQSFCSSHRAAEIINFYTTDHFADRVVADAILAQVEKDVLAGGGEEIVINRAPRYAEEVDNYMKTQNAYKAVGVAEDFFGEGFDAPVWVKKLK